MAVHCAHCNSVDTQPQGGTYGCLNCGGVTDYEGNKRVGRANAEVVERRTEVGDDITTTATFTRDLS